MTTVVQSAAPSSVAAKRAGLFIRLAAAFFDLIFVYFLSLPIRLALPAERAGDVAFWLVLLLYFSFEIWTARTPGKQLLGLSIRLPDASQPDPSTLLLRYLTKFAGPILAVPFFITQYGGFYYLAGMCNLVVLVGLLPILNDDKRSWHDEWSRTAVYRRSRMAQIANPA